MTNYEIIDLRGLDTADRHQPTAAEIWQQMIVGDISPALTQIRLAGVTRWRGYVRTSPSALADEGA